MHVILIEISNMWKARLLQCWISTFKFKISWLGAVHKKCTQLADQEGCSVLTFFGQGVIKMRMSALFVAK